MKFNGSHIPGSPFKVRVGEAESAGDPGMVTAFGSGLEGGRTGTGPGFSIKLLEVFLLSQFYIIG